MFVTRSGEAGPVGNDVSSEDYEVHSKWKSVMETINRWKRGWFKERGGEKCVCASGVELSSRGAMVVHSVRGGAG